MCQIKNISVIYISGISEWSQIYSSIQFTGCEEFIKDQGSVDVILAWSPIIQLHLHSSLVEKEPYQRLGIMEAAQTCPLTGIWSDRSSHRGLLKQVLSQESAQTGPLTGIFRNRIPLNRISLGIKPCTFYRLTRKSWKLINLAVLTLVESGAPWSCVEVLDPGASPPSYMSTHRSPWGTWNRCMIKANGRSVQQGYRNRMSSTGASFFTATSGACESI